jgi:hypothetical protein
MGCYPSSRAQDPANAGIPVRQEPIEGVAIDSGEHGRVELITALRLSSEDDRFGGFSALRIENARLLALGDRGYLWSAHIAFDADGRLQGVEQWGVRQIAAPPANDTEALFRASNGSLIAVKEGPVRLIAVEGPRPEGLDIIETAFASMPRNQGIEAVTQVLPGGGLFAVAERVREDGLHVAAVLDDLTLRRFFYRPASGFVPTGADALENALLVLERKVGWRGLSARLVRLPTQLVMLPPNSELTPHELFRIRAGLLGANFEGTATVIGSNGDVFIYLISDDNFTDLLPTLLLQLRWDAQRKPVGTAPGG